MGVAESGKIRHTKEWTKEDIDNAVPIPMPIVDEGSLQLLKRTWNEANEDEKREFRKWIES